MVRACRIILGLNQAHLTVMSLCTALGSTFSEPYASLHDKGGNVTLGLKVFLTLAWVFLKCFHHLKYFQEERPYGFQCTTALHNLFFAVFKEGIKRHPTLKYLTMLLYGRSATDSHAGQISQRCFSIYYLIWKVLFM